MNRATWSTPKVRKELAAGARFTDPGERAALAHATGTLARRPILDLGVGTGRTIPLLRPFTDDYRAVDYLPAMVEASRSANPGVRVELGDARSLEDQPASHFGLVVFSYNGIDAVSASDRRLVLRAVRRVLAPGGQLVFSTLNLTGPSFRERPWRIRVWPTRNPLRYVWQVARQVAGAPLDTVNWLRIRDGGERGDGFAVAPLSAHHYRVLAHYTSLAHQLRELSEAGFADGPLVFENRCGARILRGDDDRDVDWFHIAARRP